jgi:hypothetical protein
MAKFGRNVTTPNAMMNGHASRANSTIETFPKLHTMYIPVPTGGVTVPIMMLMENTIPKWTGSTYDVRAGRLVLRLLLGQDRRNLGHGRVPLEGCLHAALHLEDGCL